MGYHQTITLKSEKPIPPELLRELGQQLEHVGIKTSVFFEDEFALKEAQRLIKEKGPTWVLSVVDLREAVLPRASITDRLLLVQRLNSMLTLLSPQDSLTIVDAYFLAEATDLKGYMNVFEGIFESVAAQLRKVTFITRPRFNSTLYRQVEAALLGWNPSLQITRRDSELFHDRFWIVDEARGMFVGTSINGIGKKCALTDYIREDDVADIVDELRKNGLI